MSISSKSMTGYGKGESTFEDKRIFIEIKTLNGKQLDMSLRMPSAYREREFEIRSRVTKALVRGKTEVFVNVETSDAKRVQPINGEVFKEYYRQISEISNEIGIECGDICATVLRMPDVLQSPKPQMQEEEWSALFLALDGAIESICEFREQEGRVMMADIISRIEKIDQLKDAVVPFEKSRTEVVKSRIYENLKQLESSATIDNNRLEQEMIYYLEKFDITEEKVRLKNHLAYFKEVASEPASGRKLGFIAQEIGREINTLGSKANNADIQRLVVDMKDELEKIKEQILNIL